MATPAQSERRAWFSLTPRVERILNGLSILAIVILLVLLVLWRIPSKYMILLPATAQSVEPVIYVAGHPAPTGRGQLLFTYVSEPDSNLLEEIFGRLDPDATLEELPPHYSASQNEQINTQLMLNSEQTAELVALCHIGYKTLCTGGVLIDAVERYSKAGNVLQKGDVILQVNGTPVVTPDRLRSVLTTRPPGTIFNVTLRRGGKTLVVQAPSVASPQAPHGTVLGIAIDAAPAVAMPAKLPVDMKINPGNVGGPSAGLMFTLGLLNRLSPTDLTHGLRIAGTGTISLDGTVGAIGGVKQKVIGAQWAHARYFLVPVDGGNYDDARKVVGHSMTLIPVRTLDDALKALRMLK